MGMNTMYKCRWSFITLVVCLCSLLPSSLGSCAWNAGTSHVSWNGFHCLRLHDDNYRLFAYYTARQLYNEGFRNGEINGQRKGIENYIHRKCQLHGQQTTRDNCKQCLLVMTPNATSCSAQPSCIFTGGLACRFVG